METQLANEDYFDENQSLQVIKEMIQVAHKKMKNDGILFILWGWICFITNLFEYLLGVVVHTHQITVFKRSLNIILPVLGLIYTAVYIYRQSRKTTTYIGISLRYVWISMFLCLMLINLIQFNVTHKIHFELQHPIFMVFIAFAIVVTGVILRFKMIIAGGIIFGIMAYFSSYLSLHNQLLFESIAWFVAFVIPGHILYSKRNS